MESSSVSDRIREAGAALTVTERRIAEVVLDAPESVAFGTVADVAGAAGAGTATVVRFAVKLGYDGFVDLQGAVRRELTGHLRPAAQRIRSLVGERRDDVVDRHVSAEASNVQATLDAVDPATLDAVVTLLADETRDLIVLSGSASRGVATQFVHDLTFLRSGVVLVDGSTIDVAAGVALARRDTVVLAVDLRRYERWLVEALEQAAGRDLEIVAVSDSVISPLAAAARHAFVVTARSAGVLDSHVGTLALLNLLVVEVAHVRRAEATDRLDRLESAWSDALTD